MSQFRHDSTTTKCFYTILPLGNATLNQYRPRSTFMHNKKVSAFLSICTLKLRQTKMIAKKLPRNRHELFIPYAFNYNTLTRMRKFA